jgi:hypothetical protein
MDARKPARRKTPLLAYSEYVSPDPHDSIQTSRARLLLFETLKRVYPKMLRGLSDKVFPLFKKLADGRHTFWGIDGAGHVSPYELLTQPSVASSGGYRADTPASIRNRGKLKSAFDVWADAFNVTERWAKDDAIRTLGHWHRAPGERKSLTWNPIYGHSSCVAAIGERFGFEFPGWETQLLSWPSYSKALCERFEAALKKYEKATRQRAESCGLIRSRRTFSPENFEWFVLYQFAGWSSVKIIKYRQLTILGSDQSSILKGVKIAAGLVGWSELRGWKVR